MFVIAGLVLAIISKSTLAWCIFALLAIQGVIGFVYTIAMTFHCIKKVDKDKYDDEINKKEHEV